MIINDALIDLEDGNAIWKPEHAKLLCETVNVPWNDKLVFNFKTETYDPKGAQMYPGNEEAAGVDGLELTEYITKKLGITGVEYKMGRGSQAREYVKAIREKLANSSPAA